MAYKNFNSAKEYQAVYRKNNKEKLKEWHKKWYEKNKEQVKAKLKEFNLKYPGRISENRKKWADNNVEKRLLKGAKSRSKRPRLLRISDRLESQGWKLQLKLRQQVHRVGHQKRFLDPPRSRPQR